MAFIQKCNPGFILAHGKEKAFFEKVNENRPTVEFWEECKRLRKNVNQKSIDEINSLMDKDD